jgi:predicted negative regulator of RcsB-dependent stress response
MPKRISSTDGFLKSALKLARNERYEQALQVILRIKNRALSSDNLTKVALIHSYGGQLAKSELSWLEIEQRNEMQSGGYLMLASLQIELSKTELAIKSLEKEINLSKKTGNQYFVDSATIRLAYLQIQVKNYVAAKKTLSFIEDNQGDFIPTVGYKTKVDLLIEMLV